MSARDPSAVADSLTPAQRHCVLRCSDAEVYGGAGYSFPRHWYDIVHGRRWAQYRTLRALEWKGVAEPDETMPSYWRLTSLGLSVQLHLRCRMQRGEW